jgi:hypothetical protein
LVHRFCEENRAKRVEARDLREVNLVEKAQSAIQQLHRQHLPITKKSVAKIVGISPNVLSYYPSTRALMDQAKEVPLERGTQKGGQDIAEQVPSVIQQLEDSGTPVSRPEISRTLGVLPEELQFSPQVRKQLELYINYASEEPLKEEELLKLAQEMAPRVNPFDKLTLYRMIRERAGKIYGNPKKYPCVRQFVDEYAKVWQKQRREDEKAKRILQKEEERFSRLQAAVVSLQAQGKPLTWSALSEASGIYQDLLRYSPRLREYTTQCIREAAASQYLVDQQQDEDLLQRLQQAIQTQKLSNQSLSKETLGKLLHVSKKRLLECPQTKAVLDELQRDLQNDRLRQEMVIVEQVTEVIPSLRDQGYPITQRSIAKYLGIGRTLLKSYPKVRAILMTEIDANYSAIDATEQPRRGHTAIT